MTRRRAPTSFGDTGGIPLISDMQYGQTGTNLPSNPEHDGARFVVNDVARSMRRDRADRLPHQRASFGGSRPAHMVWQSDRTNCLRFGLAEPGHLTFTANVTSSTTALSDGKHIAFFSDQLPFSDPPSRAT